MSDIAKMIEEIRNRVKAAKEHPEAVGPDNDYMRGGLTHLGVLAQHAPEDLTKLCQALEAALEVLDFYKNPNYWERIEGHTQWASNLKVKDCALLNCGGGRARQAVKNITQILSGGKV